MRDVSKSQVVIKNGKYYKMVPPDGGWGYMIALAMVIVTITMVAPMSSFGIIYGEFLESHSISTSAVGLQNGASMLTYSLFAFLTNVALKRYSLRVVGLLGAALYCAGAVGGIFVNSAIELFVFGGLLTGAGSGLMATCIYTTFNLYFEKKRVFTMSACQSIISVVSIVAPILISTSMGEFGFRSTLVFLCGVALQTLVAFLLVQPVRRHLVAQEIQPMDYELHELEPLNPKEKTIIESRHAKRIDDKGTEKSKETENSFYSPNTEKLLNAKSKFVSESSSPQLNDPEKSTRSKEPAQTKVPTSKLTMVIDYMGLQMLADPIFLNVCFATSMALVSDITFVILLPLHLSEKQWTADEVALTLTLQTVGETTGSIALAALSAFFSVDSQLTFLAGVVGTTVLRFGMFSVHNTTTVMAIIATIGFFRCFIMVTSVLVIADHVAADQYPAAQGLQILLIGLLSFVAGPAAGAVRDWTGSYVTAFQALNGTAVVACAVSWTLKTYLLRRKQSRPSENK